MKKIFILILVFVSVQSFGQLKRTYYQKLNASGTIDSGYIKLPISKDSVFNYADDSFVEFTLEYFVRNNLQIPAAFSNFHLGADGIYRNYVPRAEAVPWDGVNNKPSTFPATATTVGANLLNLPNPVSVSLPRINADGTTGTRTLSQITTDLGIDQKAPINNAAFTGTFDAPNGTITNADLAGSIDLTTKVTGTLPFTNGGSSGGSTAAPATTGTMTINMTSRMITITPTGACTFNASGGIAGQMITFIITTSGTSSFTLTWGTNFRKTGTLATGTTSARFFAVSFICLADGVTWQEISRTAAQT